MEITYTLQNIDAVAKQVLEVATSKTLLFYGEMGSGKTTLIKAMLRVLGSNDLASSPTFSLVNEYHTSDSKIFHFDLYRIEDTEELYDFGIEEYLYSEDWKFIEWPDRLTDFDLDVVNILTIKVLNNGDRHLKIEENKGITPNLPMYSQNIF